MKLMAGKHSGGKVIVAVAVAGASVRAGVGAGVGADVKVTSRSCPYEQKKKNVINK